MTEAARIILDQALSLTEEERLRLAEALLDSLSADAHEQIDRAWREEVLRRMGQVRRGEVELESWEDVRSAGREALVQPIEPSELDFERLSWAFAGARSGAWQAAAVAGVDLSLLARNLELTPAERMQQLEDALRLMGR